MTERRVPWDMPAYLERVRPVLDDDDRVALLDALRAALPGPGPSPGG